MKYKKIFCLALLLFFSSNKMKSNPYNALSLALYGILTTTFIIVELKINQGLEARIEKLEKQELNLYGRVGLIEKILGKRKISEEDAYLDQV